MDALAYEVFLNEITQNIRNCIHEFYSVEEVYNLAILVYMLKKKASKFKIAHKLDSILEVLHTSTVVMNKGKYKHQEIGQVLMEMQTWTEKNLVQHFEALL